MAAPTIKFMGLPLLIFHILVILLLTHGATGDSTLNNGDNITDAKTLVSAGKTFTLGFFSLPVVPTKRYLGIWFTVSGADSVYWVANRDAPLNNTSGVLVMSAGGSLRLLDGSGQAAWSSNTTGASASAPSVLELLDSGNLVVRENSSDRVLWQSFDHPSNTLLAGMKFGRSLKTGAEWSLTSWRARDDPATGEYRRVMSTEGLPDIVTWRGGAKRYRAGPWNGRWFSGVPEMASSFRLFSVRMVDGPDEVTYVLGAAAGAAMFPTRVVLDEAGAVQVVVWDPTTRAWTPHPWLPRDACDGYASCGAFGLCRVAASSSSSAAPPSCSCVEGFSPASRSRQWSGGSGCRRDVQLGCGNGTDRFVTVPGVKLPDVDNATVDRSATLEQCRQRCLANCSCVAYAPADIRGRGRGSGCVMWKDSIVDVRYIENGQDLYVRLAKSDESVRGQETNSPSVVEVVGTRKRTIVARVVLPVMASVLVLAAAGMSLVWICKLRGKRRSKDAFTKAILGYSRAPDELGDDNIELPFVSFGDIAAATNNFCEDNMLGQGGFGKVYKGTLGQNTEVAVKRLGQGSGQGVEEFRNEVVLIAKLQHRNLVRLLGCCIDEEEKLLIYEYLPNKSLDSFIFDAASKYLLDWPTRFKIIKGISRGLLYLHQDSRLTIVHRDLKPSNILLDADMSPKISDFGMARIFGGNQQEANTNRVVGTYGYMSPEYAMDGAFSVKSDTYSFGVIVLEVISGLKITLSHYKGFPNLLAYAWSLWIDGKAMDLVDSSLATSCSRTEALRCIQIGFMCVQDNPNYRPLMSSVVTMLENESTPLSVPKQPVYFSYTGNQGTIGQNTSNSTNGMTLTTLLEGR